MYAIVNKFLLTGDKFMPEIHLSQDLHSQGLHITLVVYSLKIKKE